MNGWQIGLLVWLAFSGLILIGQIGKPRKPSTPGAVIIAIFILAIEAFAVTKA